MSDFLQQQLEQIEINKKLKIEAQAAAEQAADAELLALDAAKMTGVDDVADKLTRSGWLRMEQQHSPFTKTVLDTLMRYGMELESKVYFKQDNTLIPIGEALYLSHVRPHVLALGVPLPPAQMVAQPKTKKKGKGKKNKNSGQSMSRDEIRITKTITDIEKFLPAILAAADGTPKAKENRAEFRLVQFILWINKILKLIQVEPNSHMAYESLIGLHNAISSAKAVEGLAPQVMADANTMLELLSETVRFSYEELLTVYPRLVFTNRYSDLYHESVIEPYPDQKRMIDVIDDHPKALVFFNTVPGSGKTTAVVGVVSRIQKRNALRVVATNDKVDLNKGGRTYKLRKRFQPKVSQRGAGGRVCIFVCTNILVREQVGRDAYNADLPFAVAANSTFREHNNARVRDPLLIISDLETAMDMLERYTDPILFVDEPTIAAETDHVINEKIMQLLAHAPRQTILSSATLPRPHELPTLVKLYQHRWCDGKDEGVVSIQSTRIGIGCHAVESGMPVLPFEGRKTTEELSAALETLKTNPFLFRFLSIEVVMTLRSRMDEVGIHVSSLADIFSGPSNISHQKIAAHAVQLLEMVVGKKDDAQAAHICAPIQASRYQPYDMKKLLTEHAHQHMQGALFATMTPLETALETADLFLKELPSVDKMLKEYNRKKESYDSARARIIKNVKKENEQVQQIQALPIPSMQMPPQFVPNTVEHVRKFGPPGIKYDPGAVQNPPLASSIPQDLNVPGEVLLLLYLGIGIYSPGSQVLNANGDTRYTEKVVELCSNGYISFLFADRAIVYGTNFPFSNVLIDPKFAAASSLNTLYQLIGRAGRVGRSYMAKVFLLGTDLKNRIVSFDEENIEAMNLESSLQKVIDRMEVNKENPYAAVKPVKGLAEEKKEEAQEAAPDKKGKKEASKNQSNSKQAAVVEPVAEDGDWDDGEEAPEENKEAEEDMGDWDDSD